MINLTNATLTNCIIHKVGNKVLDQDLKLSTSEVLLNDELEIQLKGYFLKPFKIINESFRFHHEIDIKMNEVFTCTDNIFEEENFIKNSVHLVKHLYNQTRYSSIKPGEVFISLFDEVVFDNTICQALGIFKSEKKEAYFKIDEKGGNINLISDKGINEHKLDKGCLILNDKYHEGFIVFTYEYGGADTDYWRNDFLSIKPSTDKINQTNAFIDLLKEYSSSHIKESFGKQEQVAFMNHSFKYISNTDVLDIGKFEQEMFSNTEQRKYFKEFKNTYLIESDVKLSDIFDIAKNIVTQQKKKIRNEIKLDTNILIKLEGQNLDYTEQFIEKGFDNKRKMNYYKIYFNKEK